MAEDAPTRARVGKVTLVLMGIVGLAAVANLVLLAAYGGVLLDGWPVQTAALIAALGVLGVVFALPALVAGGVLSVLRRRFKKLKPTRAFVGIVGLYQIVLAGVTVTQTPEPLPELLKLRGTWVLDAAIGRGPFGPAAVDTARTLLAEARAADDLHVLAEQLSDESAGGLALHWILVLDGTRPSGDEGAAAALKGFAQGQGLDLVALRRDASKVDVSGRGRPLLHAVADLMDGQRRDLAPPVAESPLLEWPEMPEQPGIRVIDRTTLALDSGGVEARYEDGAWRLHLARTDWARTARAKVDRLEPKVALWQLQRATEAARVGAIADAFAEVTGDRAGAEEKAAQAEAAAKAAAEDAALQPVRDVFAAAARGRIGWMAGTTAHDGAWPASLTRKAAIAQAERIRTWCATDGASDGLITSELEALSARYGLEEPDAAAREARLVPRARAYLADVLMVCAPLVVARQGSDASFGLDDAHRARWAALDAGVLLGSATLTRNPDGVTIEAEGRSWRAVEQDGAWRVDWAD